MTERLHLPRLHRRHVPLLVLGALVVFVLLYIFVLAQKPPCAMFTVRINPKMSANPLATMKRAEANVSESSTIFRNDDGSCTA